MVKIKVWDKVSKLSKLEVPWLVVSDFNAISSKAKQ